MKKFGLTSVLVGIEIFLLAPKQVLAAAPTPTPAPAAETAFYDYFKGNSTWTTCFTGGTFPMQITVTNTPPSTDQKAMKPISQKVVTTVYYDNCGGTEFYSVTTVGQISYASEDPVSTLTKQVLTSYEMTLLDGEEASYWNTKYKTCGITNWKWGVPHALTAANIKSCGYRPINVSFYGRFDAVNPTEFYADAPYDDASTSNLTIGSSLTNVGPLNTANAFTLVDPSLLAPVKCKVSGTYKSSTTTDYLTFSSGKFTFDGNQAPGTYVQDGRQVMILDSFGDTAVPALLSPDCTQIVLENSDFASSETWTK